MRIAKAEAASQIWRESLENFPSFPHSGDLTWTQFRSIFDGKSNIIGKRYSKKKKKIGWEIWQCCHQISFLPLEKSNDNLIWWTLIWWTLIWQNHLMKHYGPSFFSLTVSVITYLWIEKVQGWLKKEL